MNMIEINDEMSLFFSMDCCGYVTSKLNDFYSSSGTKITKKLHLFVDTFVYPVDVT